MNTASIYEVIFFDGPIVARSSPPHIPSRLAEFESSVHNNGKYYVVNV